MSKTVRYRIRYTLSRAGLNLAVCIAFGFWCSRMRAGFYPAEALPFAVAAVLALYCAWMLVELLVRTFSPIGCFRITPDGLEFLPVGLRLWFFRLPVYVRRLPWSCIGEIRLERAGGRTCLRFCPVDEADFPRGYSQFVRALLERARRQDQYGLTADITCAAADAQQLAAELQQLLTEFRTGGFSLPRFD